MAGTPKSTHWRNAPLLPDAYSRRRGVPGYLRSPYPRRTKSVLSSLDWRKPGERGRGFLDERVQVTRISEAERRKVIALLREGLTPYAVAKQTKPSRPTVYKIAREEGIEVDVKQTKKATEARKAYAEKRRLEIIGKGFDKADELLKPITEAGEFQKWTVGLGTLIDKARLETGEATSREERWSGDVREKHFDKLFGQLDAYRTGFDDGHGARDPVEPVDTGSPNL